MTRPGGNPERARLADADSGRAPWRRWGPYVAERAWGGVREDYSADGDAWSAFPFEQAASRTYRWNEDGLSAWCDDGQHLCLGLALWNGVDPILKDRYFGLSGPQGNHGEDAKDYWWYVDATPTHSYQCTRYAYPLREFPYADLVATNRARDRAVGEYELIDTGIFDDDDYVMVTSQWAKAAPEDLCVQVDVHNRSNHPATVHVLPTIWFRNTWSWGAPPGERPVLRAEGAVLRGHHPALGDFSVMSRAANGVIPGGPAVGGELVFCDNETNVGKLYGTTRWAGATATPYPKDGIADHVIRGAATVNPERRGTKAAFRHTLAIPAGGHATVRLRMTMGERAASPGDTVDKVDQTVRARRSEADRYWQSVLGELPAPEAHVARQAFAGLLSSKQYYPYDVRRWLAGDPAQPAPPAGHRSVRNAAWRHLAAEDIICMPDPWEYPWFAAWDLAFHCVPLALIDPELAKQQLLLLLGDRYQHPSGDLPAYEWDFSDTNPPVQAWAARQVFEITGQTDTAFLSRVLHKLLMNFTWWLNRVDADGNNVFEGGFLGLDNIGAFDRSEELPDGLVREQSDGTAWMALYCLDLLRITVTLAESDRTYAELAVTFFDHFCQIVSAADDLGLWNEQDGFYYDQLRDIDGAVQPVRIRSAVGLIPLAAVAGLPPGLAETIPELAARIEWLRARRPHLIDGVFFDRPADPRLLSMADRRQWTTALAAMLDPAEFLSEHGLRSLSARHRDHPAVVKLGGQLRRVGYEPAESRTPLFGGNSNWRGPVWFPINALLIAALRRYDAHAASRLRVEYPTGSGEQHDVATVAEDLSARLLRLFLPGPDGRRPCQRDLPWQEDVLFSEYFHGDTGAGLGASHQTGWTALVAALALGWPR